MLGLPRSLKHASHGLKLHPTTVKDSLKLGQSRSVLVRMQTTPGNTNRSFSATSSFSDNFPYRGVGTIDDAIARSSGSSCSCEDNAVVPTSEVQTAAVELPEIPRIQKKRTFHINHADLEARMRPLLSCHWHVSLVGSAVDDGDDRLVLSLNKLFRFKDFRAAVEFFDALADVQDEECHHARVIVDYAYVYVSVHTHVAYQQGSTSVPTKPIKIPGLTARDVRFAVKVEKLHEKFLGDGRAVTKVPADSAGLQAWSMEQLRRRYPPPHGQDTGRENTAQAHD